MANEWIDVPGWEDRYQVTVCGKIRSKPRTVNSPAAGGSRRIKGKVLKPNLVRGYPAIQINYGGKRKTLYLHRLIAAAFIPNPSKKPHINHIDGNRTNNNPDNLEWCTHKENMAHAYRLGLATAPNVGPGEDCPAAKLTEKEVVGIKESLRLGQTIRSIAKKHGVSNGTIGFIKAGKTWRHVKP